MADRLTNQRITSLEKWVSGSIRDVEATLYSDSNVILTSTGTGTYSISITTIDSINLVAGTGQRLFLAKQTNKSEIGVYGIISATGVTPMIVQLTTDFTNDNLFNNTRVQIQQGTNYAGNFYLCSGIGNTKSVVQTDQALDNLQVAVSTLQSNISSQPSLSLYVAENGNDTTALANMTKAFQYPFATVQVAVDNTVSNRGTVFVFPKSGGYDDTVILKGIGNSIIFLGSNISIGDLIVTDQSGGQGNSNQIINGYWNNLNVNNYADNVGGNIYQEGSFNDVIYSNFPSSTNGIINADEFKNTTIYGNVVFFATGFAKQVSPIIFPFRSVRFNPTASITIHGNKTTLLFVNCENIPSITLLDGATSSQITYNPLIGDGSNISNINKISKTLPNEINTLTGKVTLVDNDVILGEDSVSDPVFGKIKVNFLNLFTSIINKFSNNNIQYVTPNGNNTNNGFSLMTGVATLAQAQTNLRNVAGTIIICPKVGGYSETTTITAQNITIIGLTKNQAVQFTNPITFAHTASNIQVSDIGFTTLIHNNAGGLYLRGGSVTTSLTKSGAGYLEARGVDLQATSTTISVTGTGSITFTDGTVLGTTTINNAGAVVSIMNCLNSKAITLTAGVLGINNTTVYSASAGANAISIASGSILYSTNSTFMINGTNTEALINIASGSFYSLIGCSYSASSTILGTMLTRTAIFDAIRLLTPLSISSGGTGQTTASASLNALLPSQTGQNGNILQTDGTTPSWVRPSGGSGNSSTYYRSYNTAATNGVFVQTITGTGTVNWLTVASTTQRLTINNNVFQTGGFTQTASNITIPTTGVYTINLNITPTVTSTNREVWVQLVKTTGGTPTVINCSAEYNGGAGNNGFVALSYTGSFAINDIIDFRVDTLAGTPSIGIGAYSIFISAVSVPSTTATSTPTANTVSQWDNNKNFNANNYQADSLPVVSSATVVNLTVASPRVISVTGTSNQNILLPDPATLKYGHTVIIENGSTGIINVGDNLANYFISILPNKLNTFTLSNTGTWGYDRTVTGFVALNTVMCIGDLFFQLTVTGGKGMTIRPQNANIVAQAVGETFYGVNQTYYNSTNNNASLPTASYNSALPWTGTTTNNNTLKQDIYDVTNGKTYSFFAQFRASSCTISAEIKNT